jgi:hypothetical protein
MKRTLLALLFPLAFAGAGCHSWIVVDGVEVAYANVDFDMERYPRYAYRGGYVYEVNGDYYGRHGQRWVRYRDRPRDIGRHPDHPGRR